MSLSRLSISAAAATCALTLGACSAPSPLTPAATGSFAQVRSAGSAAANTAAVAAPLLYVSVGRENLIEIYDALAPHALVGQITDGLVGPNAQTVDSKGDLFVANADGASVTVYAPGATKPFRTYTKDLNNPLTPAVAPDGTLFVSDFNPDGSGQVLEFPPHQLTPAFKIPLSSGANGLALDSHGNLYATVLLNSVGRVLKFAPKSTKGKDLGITLNFPGRIAVDPSGNIIVCDQTAPAVEVFPPGATKPSKEITQGFVDPFAVALSHDLKRLYVADGAGDTVTEYSYPALTLLSTIHRPNATFGLSLSPAAPL